MDKSTRLSLKALEHQASRAVINSHPTHGSAFTSLALAVFKAAPVLDCFGS